MRPAPSVPGDDPLDEAVLSADDLSTVRTWLTTARLQCTPTVPVNPAMVAGLLAAYESAESRAVAARVVRRVATREARRERDEALGRCRAVAVLLREMANRSSVPPAGRLRQLADQLGGES